MSEFPPDFIGTFKALAEGQLEPNDWLERAWRADLDAFEEPATAEEIAAVEAAIGAPPPVADPAVYYYAHSEEGATRKLADSFTAWLEKLPRSPVFQD
ncbi:MAG TPA: hypothetical protein VGD45_26730 [Steroidobacter sp.]|uniref:hypothetical protein n=1 Tax=Steroidobacter sp. TaxID=1978227 RepID=UPI002ED8FF92